MAEDQLAVIFECVFEEESTKAKCCCSFKELECWDSLRYVQLVAALESTFEIELDAQQISLLITFQGLCDVLAQHAIEVGQKND